MIISDFFSIVMCILIKRMKDSGAYVNSSSDVKSETGNEGVASFAFPILTTDWIVILAASLYKNIFIEKIPNNKIMLPDTLLISFNECIDKRLCNTNAIMLLKIIHHNAEPTTVS